MRVEVAAQRVRSTCHVACSLFLSRSLALSRSLSAVGGGVGRSAVPPRGGGAGAAATCCVPRVELGRRRRHVASRGRWCVPPTGRWGPPSRRPGRRRVASRRRAARGCPDCSRWRTGRHVTGRTGRRQCRGGVSWRAARGCPRGCAECCRWRTGRRRQVTARWRTWVTESLVPRTGGVTQRDVTEWATAQNGRHRECAAVTAVGRWTLTGRRRHVAIERVVRGPPRCTRRRRPCHHPRAATSFTRAPASFSSDALYETNMRGAKMT
jgi:hypothetical protein